MYIIYIHYIYNDKNKKLLLHNYNIIYTCCIYLLHIMTNSFVYTKYVKLKVPK